MDEFSSDPRMAAAKAGLKASSQSLSRAWSEVPLQTPHSRPPAQLPQEHSQSPILTSKPTWLQRLAAALAAWKQGAR